MATTVSPVGQLLRHWRSTRRMSQLALALEAGSTQRHVSFVESGRAQPGREMVLTLARVLDVPLRERNQLLLAAGFAPVYREAGLDAPEARQVSAAVDRMLSHHEPYPAVVMDRHWNIVRTNAAAEKFFGWLLGAQGPAGTANVVRLMFDPSGLRPHVMNWEEVAESLVQRVHRECVGGVPDPQTLALLEEVLGYPGVPERWQAADFGRAPVPVVPVRFAKEGVEVSYFSMVTTLGTPLDAALQELRIESFFPADGD